MNELILKKLIEIEERFQVKVLYAVESGSRAWGIHSKDSDYDVRFIYIHQPNWYLSIDPQGVGAKRDVIELPINDVLDISGWEITKALRLFRKGNPTLLEWLRSDNIYCQKPSLVTRLRSLAPEIFNPTASLHHYLNMAKNNYQLYLQKSEIKNCLYAIRSILACKWIKENKTPPPIRFNDLVGAFVSEGQLRKKIEHLVVRKMAGYESEKEVSISIMNECLESEISRIEAYVQTLSVKVEDSTKKLDDLFRNVLKEMYK
ncbi:nucleotidyltransferase domain-containing protein [Sporosarcina pasteurii]|uniref:Predicted nucleotidyltransferase n=1 Tax=Sporosarcina pasteurii TaxID=1474 RepID=A0A380CLI5_SPOPA|nr:nucleotidyltransferase domain-containing protein [Sporosarcina pasteurii]MDS9471874.1 nucleotidyltransferase domain-containing protein [Sporosarcina pasteurii]QBQ06611.1 nucleotidyltransferase domain-containing protein [Sporosarcina pasteurii]SUJ21990.1 Predicted nucleotidyltransferase [Sporosarcina pasteurii]